MGWSRDGRTGPLGCFLSSVFGSIQGVCLRSPGLYLTISARCHSVSHTNSHHFATPSTEQLAGQLHSRLIPVRHWGPGYGSEFQHTPFQVAEEEVSLCWDTDTRRSVIRAWAVISSLQTPHCCLFILESPLTLGKKCQRA